MLFSKFRIFKFSEAFELSDQQIADMLSASLFKRIERPQVQSSGFVNPFTLYPDKPVYSRSGFVLLTLRVDSKPIPASAVKAKVKQRVKEAEKRNNGEKLAKEEKEAIKEQVTSEMIANFPMEFVKTKHIYALFLREEQVLLVNSTSSSDIELILGSIRGAFGSLPVMDFETLSAPMLVMSSWLQNEKAASSFEILDECQMRDVSDEKGAVVQFKKHDLSATEVVSHLDNGMGVSMLSLLWNDSLKFKLRSDLAITGVAYSDILKESLKERSSDGGASKSFDAEIFTFTENAAMLIPSLETAFG